MVACFFIASKWRNPGFFQNWPGRLCRHRRVQQPDSPAPPGQRLMMHPPGMTRKIALFAPDDFSPRAPSARQYRQFRQHRFLLAVPQTMQPCFHPRPAQGLVLRMQRLA